MGIGLVRGGLFLGGAGLLKSLVFTLGLQISDIIISAPLFGGDERTPAEVQADRERIQGEIVDFTKLVFGKENLLANPIIGGFVGGLQTGATAVQQIGRNFAAAVAVNPRAAQKLSKDLKEGIAEFFGIFTADLIR